MSGRLVKALVLSGGGARSAYEAGVAKSLLQQDSYDVVCGASIGAINAAFVAQGRSSDLERLWRTIALSEVGGLGRQAARIRHMMADMAALGAPHRLKELGHFAHAFVDFVSLGRRRGASLRAGVADPTPLARLLEQNLDLDALRSSLLITATNLTRGTATVFYKLLRSDAEPDAAAPTLRDAAGLEAVQLTPPIFVSAVLASASLPGLFEPLEMDLGGNGRSRYADGGIANNTPIRLAIDAGATDVTVVFVNPADDPGCSCPGGLGQMACTIAVLLRRRLIEDEMRLVQATNETVRLCGLTDRRIVGLRQVRPAQPLPLGLLEFDNQAAVDAAFERGVDDGKNPQSL